MDMDKKLKIAIINTNPLTYSMLNGIIAQELPEAELFNIMDDSILPQARATGLTPDILEKLRLYLKCAQISGADLIIHQSSSVSEAVDLLQKELSVPYIKIDAPMAEKAVLTGENITVLATAESTLRPSAELIARTAEKLGRRANVKTVFIPGAIDMLAQPDGESKHNALIIDAIKREAPHCDVIALAQASMHRVIGSFQPVGVPVLSSPKTMTEKIRQMFL